MSSVVTPILRPYSTITKDGAAVSQDDILEFEGNVVVTPDPGRGRTIVSVGTSSSSALSGSTLTTTGNATFGGSAAVAGAITGASLTTTGNVTAGGSIIEGPSVSVHGTASTTGPGTAALLSLPIAANSVAKLDIMIAAACMALPGSYLYRSADDAGYFTFGGTGSVGSIPVESGGGMGIFPSVAAGTYSGGHLPIVAHGPGVTVTASANSGGKLRLTVTPATLDTSTATIAVTVSGLSGTPGGNGAHTGTIVAENLLDLLTVTYVAPDTSGSIVLTTPSVITWSAWARIVVTP